MLQYIITKTEPGRRGPLTVYVKYINKAEIVISIETEPDNALAFPTLVSAIEYLATAGEKPGKNGFAILPVPAPAPGAPSERSVARQYQLYLQRVALAEERMHPEQRRQLKQAFYCSWAQCLIYQRDDVAFIGNIEGDDAAAAIMQAQLDEIAEFVTVSMAEGRSPGSNPLMN